MDSLASKIHANLDLKSLVLLRVSPFLLFLQVLKVVRGASLAKGPDSSLGEVLKGSWSGNIHMEEERVEVKVQEDEAEDGRDNEGSNARVEERTNNHSGA